VAPVPDPVELILPEGFDAHGVRRALGGHFEVDLAPPSSSDRVFLDTFDGRMHAAGVTVWREVRTRSGQVPVTLEEPGARPMTARCPVVAGRIIASDLPDGALRTRLRALSAGRALLSTVRVRIDLQPVGVCNGDGKTVTRIVIEDPSVVLPSGVAAPLRRRARITPVLGYGRAFARTTKLMTAAVGVDAVDETLVSEAMAAAHLPVGGVSSKIGVDLDPDMRADRASGLLCRRLAEIVEANLPGTLADIDTEFLHDLRVAVRRTRSVLKEMDSVLTSAEVARARDDLKWIQAVTGPTRDLDVQLEGWSTLVTSARAPADDLAVLHELLEARRARAFTVMRRALRSERFDHAWTSWRRQLDHLCAVGVEPDDGEPAAPVAALASARIASVYKKMTKLGSAIDDGSPPEDLHDLRKRGKELRYLLELFGGMWPGKAVTPLVDVLKELQDVLGRFQDGQVQATYLRDLGPQLATAPGGPDALIALGGVLDALAADQRLARETFAKRFAPFASAKTRALVIDGLRPERARGRVTA